MVNSGLGVLTQAAQMIVEGPMPFIEVMDMMGPNLPAWLNEYRCESWDGFAAANNGG